MDSLDSITISSFIFTCTTLIATYMVYKLWKGIKIRSKLPRFPGFYYPILGNYKYEIRGEELLHKFLHLQREKKSDAITISLPAVNTYNVIITDFKLAKECFVKNGAHCSARVFVMMENFSYFLKKFFTPKYTIGFSSGKYWHDIRRKAFGSLRELGVGKNRLEELVNIETEYLIESISFMKGESSKEYLMNMLATATTNVICQLCFGIRFSYDDTEFKWLYQNINAILGGKLFFHLKMFLPKILRRAPLIYNEDVEKFVSSMSNIREFIEKQVRRQQQSLRNNANDFEISQEDCLLKTLVKDFHKNPNPRELDMMISVMNDMFIAGTDTTSVTLLWAIYFLRNHPEIQNVLKQEIAENVISDHIVNSDIQKLHLCHAFLLETFRFSAIAPIVGPHLVTEQFSANGYTIPKGTFLDAATFCIHRDNKVFKNPDNFDINNFLNNGIVAMPEGFMPFGIGPRICFGEKIARIEAFVFLANIIKNFSFSPVNSNDSITDDDALLGLVRSPKSFTVNISAK